MQVRVGFVCLLAAALGGAWQPARANVISTFSTDQDGWTSVTLAFPNPGAPPAVLNTYTPTWNPAGGNPGGYISNPDPDGNVQYWHAPAQFLGNLSDYLNGSLSFDVEDAPASGPFTEEDVIVTGGGLTLTHQLSGTPTGTWATFSVPLSAAGWTINTRTGAAASSTDMQTLLSSVTNIYIRGEFYLSNDTQALDNVVLAAGVPEPATAVSMALALLGLTLVELRRRR